MKKDTNNEVSVHSEKDANKLIMEMFDKRFYDKGTPDGLNHTYKTVRHIVDAIRDDFISHIITLVQKRKREEMVEMVERIEKYTSQENYWDEQCLTDRFNRGALNSRTKMKDWIINLIKTK